MPEANYQGQRWTTWFCTVLKLGTELQQWHGNRIERHMFGCPTTSCTPTTLQIVFDFIMVERHMTVEEMQHGTGID
jgi:hypothetical protein